MYNTVLTEGGLYIKFVSVTLLTSRNNSGSIHGRECGNPKIIMSRKKRKKKVANHIIISL